MGMLALAGRDMNVIAGGTFSSSPAASVLFPWALAADRRSGSFGRFGSLTATPLVWVDIDVLRGIGGFEVFSGGGPVGFVLANSGTSTITQESTTIHSGSFAGRFAAVGGQASCYVDVVVRAGQRFYMEAYLRGDGGLGRIKVNVRNLSSGNWLNGGAWSSTPNDVFNESGTPYALHFQEFQVESAAACGNLRPTLRFQLINPNAGTVSFADSFFVVPAVTFAAAIGHNIDARSAPELRTSVNSNFSSSTLVATPTLRRTAFYASFAPVYRRYWGWQFADTNAGQGPIYLAEWVQGDPLSLLQPPEYPIVRSFRDPQVRGELPYGGEYVVGVGPEGQAMGGVQLSFRQNDAAVAEFLEEIYMRSSGGHPMVVVPDHTKPDVFFGRIPRTWDTRRVQLAIHDSTLELAPSPMPLLVP